jgi:uncharacterized protein YaaN involved in tellurite resistance
MVETSVVSENNLTSNQNESFVRLDESSLQSLGLTSADFPVIHELAAKIDESNPLSVSQFGRDVSEHTSKYADELLDQVRNSDLEETGSKLTQVVSVAKTLNMNALTERRSTIPVIGKLIDKFKLSAGSFMGQFETTKTQIESLIGEVNASQAGLAKRNSSLEEMFCGVKEEHRLLGIHIAAGKIRLDELRIKADELRTTVTSPNEVQSLADLDLLISNLDKRIGDLQSLQHSALQSLPMIRMIQSNNQVLVDKFHTIKEITVPAWKRQFMLALSLNEQRNAVDLANNIDNTTNDLLRRNADLLHRNSVEAAKANQRLVIDIDTLKEVQNKLISTVEEVIQIQQQGVKSRQKAEKDIMDMRLELRDRLTKISHLEDKTS